MQLAAILLLTVSFMRIGVTMNISEEGAQLIFAIAVLAIVVIAIVTDYLVALPQ